MVIRILICPQKMMPLRKIDKGWGGGEGAKAEEVKAENEEVEKRDIGKVLYALNI